MIYLDNAATTFPKPRSVIKSTSDCIKRYCGNPARSSHALSLKASEAIYDTRESVARLLGINCAENVVFTLNATYALNLAIKTTVPHNSHVIISDCEHNSVLRPLVSLKERLGVEYSLFDSGAKDIEQEIRSHIRENTRAIISTVTSNVTGQRIPLEPLSRLRSELGLSLIIDASQAIGHFNIDLTKTPCDVLCAPGHKALFGIQGCGFAVFCDNRSRESFIEGGSGSDSKNIHMPSVLPERFEAGTLPTPSIVSLGAGIKYINNIGIEHIESKMEALENTFADMISGFKRVKIYGKGTGIISFDYEGISSSALAYKMGEFGVCVRGGLHCAPLTHKKLGTSERGLLRVSFSSLNTKKDLEEAYKCLKAIFATV